jgi:hypothetical protein
MCQRFKLKQAARLNVGNLFRKFFSLRNHKSEIKGRADSACFAMFLVSPKCHSRPFWPPVAALSRLSLAKFACDALSVRDSADAVRFI